MASLPLSFLQFVELAVVLGIVRVLLKAFKVEPVDLIPGPLSPSWLYGNMCQLRLTLVYGEHEYQWLKKFGPLYRIKGCFGENRLMVSDFAAAKHILDDPETFIRSPQQQAVVHMLLGETNVFHVTGPDHRRMRNIMQSAFTPATIRALPAIFANLAEKTMANWERDRATLKEGEPLDLYHSIQCATLDAVGEGVIGYSFGTLDNDDNELAQCHQNIISTSGATTKADILFEGLTPHIPQAVLRSMQYLPSPAFAAVRHNKKVSAKVSEELLRGQIAAFEAGDETGKDLLGVMVRGNASMKASQQMSHEEMQWAIPSLMIAGQDTTGSTLSMALLELARNQDFQEKIRKEVTEAYLASGEDVNFAYDNLPHLSSFLKEVLRIHPQLPMSERTAAKDSVIPLSTPIINTRGEKVTEIPVSKGQHVTIATAAYNRQTSLWGEDADEFNPYRFMEGGCAANLPNQYGPYAGLASFLGGGRMCVGWRFALVQVSVIFANFVRKYHFSLSRDKELFNGANTTLAPVTADGKICLPLVVKPIAEL